MWKPLLAVFVMVLGLGSAFATATADRSAVGQISANQSSGTYVMSTAVAAAVKAMSPTAVSDVQLRVVDAGGYNVAVGIVQRPARPDQGALAHDNVTEVYYVLEGAGTLVTGGALAGPSRVAADTSTVRELVGPSMRGAGVQSGESRPIAAGDVVIIPAGVPHGFSAVEKPIRYLVVRMDPARVLPLK